MTPYFRKTPLDEIDISAFPAGSNNVNSPGFIAALTFAMAKSVGASVVGNANWNSADHGMLNVSVIEGVVHTSFIPRGMTPAQVAVHLFREEKYGEGIDFLEFMIREHEPDADVLFNLGLAYNETGRFDEAVQRLGRAAEIRPEQADIWVAMGLAYYKLGKLEKAEASQRRALLAEPGNLRAKRNLGAILSESNRFREALPVMQEVLAALPSDPRVALGVAMTTAMLGDEAEDDEVSAAESLCRHLITSDAAPDITESARRVSSQLVQINLKRNNLSTSSVRLDVVMYIGDALTKMASMTEDARNQAVLELAQISAEGVAINDPDSSYPVRAFGESFTGLKLMAYLYAGINQIRPGIDIGIDFSREYAIATKKASGA